MLAAILRFTKLKPISPIQAARTANETAQMATRLITFTVQVYSVGAQPRKNSFSIPRIVVVIRPFPARAETGQAPSLLQFWRAPHGGNAGIVTH
jgi:hypothetical protein